MAVNNVNNLYKFYYVTKVQVVSPGTFGNTVIVDTATEAMSQSLL